MELKEAISLAKKYIQDVFGEEQIRDIGLEEIEFDESSETWNITIGFSRPWNRKSNIPLEFLGGTRNYKVVRTRMTAERSCL